MNTENSIILLWLHKEKNKPHFLALLNRYVMLDSPVFEAKLQGKENLKFGAGLTM